MTWHSQVHTLGLIVQPSWFAAQRMNILERRQVLVLILKVIMNVLEMRQVLVFSFTESMEILERRPGTGPPSVRDNACTREETGTDAVSARENEYTL